MVAGVIISSFLTRKPRRDDTRPPIKDDPQKWLVYRMERRIIGQIVYHRVKRDHLQLIADHACKKWNVIPVTINEYRHKERVFGWYDYSGDVKRIRLNSRYNGMNAGTMLHELAHHITYQLWPDAEDHGPEFCDVYATLLDSYKMLPYECFLLLAKQHGIAVGEY
jgi:hypothetical protein